MSLVLNLLVITASVLGSWMAFPQARRLVRTRDVGGVSASWIGVSMALNSWWIAYGVAAHVWAVIPVSIVSLALYVTIAVVFVQTAGRDAVGGLLGGSLLLGMIPLPFVLYGGWEFAGFAIGLCYGLQLLPAVVGVYRTRELTGVSAATWFIAALEATIWFVYGLGVSDIALVFAGAVGTAMSVLILGRLAVTGHRPFEVIRVGRRVAHVRS